MKKHIKKYGEILSCIIFVMGILLICGQSVNAKTISGQCGVDVHYDFDIATGVIKIYGNGPMVVDDDYYESILSEDAGNIKQVEIAEGVTEIGESAFENCSGLEQIKIPGSVIRIGYNAFNNCSKLANVMYGGTEEEWNKISIGYDNSCLTSAKIKFGAQNSTNTNTNITKADKNETTTELVNNKTDTPISKPAKVKFNLKQSKGKVTLKWLYNLLQKIQEGQMEEN